MVTAGETQPAWAPGSHLSPSYSLPNQKELTTAVQQGEDGGCWGVCLRGREHPGEGLGQRPAPRQQR